MSLPCFWLHHGRRIGDADPAVEAVAGSDPPISACLDQHRGESRCTSPSSPPPGGHSRPAVPCGEGPTARRSGASRFLVGDAGQPIGQPVGGQVLRRPGARLDTLPGRIAAPLATPGGRGRRVRKHTRPRTRTRPSDWGVASVTARAARAPRANGAARPKDVAAPSG